jgi:hypothetical protein
MALPSALSTPSLVIATGLIAGSAGAQVHWDVGGQAGIAQRVQTGPGAGVTSPIPGPMVEANAHVAVVPMLRLGPYFVYEAAPYAPSADLPARQFGEAGMRAKLSPPILGEPWHLWALLGLGYGLAYWPSHTQGAVHSGQIEGNYLDLPVGMGVGYRVRGPGSPLELTAELAARVGLAFFGEMYSDAPRDSIALTLSVGVSLQR